MTTLSKEQLEEKIDYTLQYKIPPSYYRDINGKEWIVVLKPEYPSWNNKSLKHPRCDSSLYDVKNDKFIPFIKNYQKDIRDKLTLNQKNKQMNCYSDINHMLLTMKIMLCIGLMFVVWNIHSKHLVSVVNVS